MDIIRKNIKRNVRRDGEVPGAPSGAGFKTRATPLNSRPLKKPKRRIWKKILLVLVATLLLGFGALVGTYFYVKTAPIAGENSGRINILVMGVDKVARLSDTIMIVSLDTRVGKEPRLAMISLPRDLQVNIPEFGVSRINAAYSYGENNNYQGGGLALASKTVEDTFDIKIHHYAVLNFEGFKDLVDAAGGVDIDVKESIDDPFYPKPDYSGVIDFNIEEGLQHMNGELALKYARSRYTTSDFDRAARQQQVILALKDKILNPETLWHPSRIEKINNAITKNIQSDLNPRQLTKLFLLFRKIHPNNTTRHVIDSTNFLVPSYGGSSSYIPKAGDFSEINTFIDGIFSQDKNTLPEAQSE